MKRVVRENLVGLAAMAAIAVVGLACAVYILGQQRVKSPFAERYEVRAEFAAAAGLTPGSGQPVNVAGVKVGQVAGVELRDGRALVSLEMDPGKLPAVFADARARLVPRTPLKDLQVELFPGRRGGRELPEGGVIPVARTAPPIDADELLRALDGDTRDFLRVLLAESARGLEGRGDDLRKVLGQLQPTAEQLASISAALKRRRGALRRLVGELSTLARAAGRKDAELATLVSAGNATLGALAAEERALRTSVRDLPGTLAATRRAVQRVAVFTAELRPALVHLRPAAVRLAPTLRSLDPVTSEAPGILRTQLRPFVRELRPLARDLRPVARDLHAALPDLRSSVQTLNYVVNTLAYNPPGDDEGLLFWTAWFAHNAASFLSTQDANGPAWRGLLLASCDGLEAQPQTAALLGALFGALPVCP